MSVHNRNSGLLPITTNLSEIAKQIRTMKNSMNLALLFSLLFLLTGYSEANSGPTTPTKTATNFVGSSSCVQCHTAEYKDWQESDHKKSMQIASPDTVLGDFSDVTVTFHSIKTRLFRQGDEYKIESIGADTKPRIFPVKYTFGHYPLQQYLVDIGKGHLQALNVAWDSRPKDKGGQRWFHLQPDEEIKPGHPFFWTAHFQNWNSRCAECHSTNLEKNFNPIDSSYQTHWSEINVSCEACHGAASQHVSLAKQKKLDSNNSGFEKQMEQALIWGFKGDDDIATSSGVRDSNHINTCGGCHSRHSTLDNLQPLANFHDQYRLSTLDQGLYFPDGQINDEVFVLGSFLQSKMHQKGVTCNNCHNPHSGKLVAEGNNLCTQCHKPTTYDVPNHHHHKLGSTGSLCISCHMPERTYMSVDPRRDHSFVIPDPGLSAKLNTPNSCTNCHKDKSNKWSSQAMTRWGIAKRYDAWAVLNNGLSKEDILLFKEYAQGNLADSMPAIRQATLLEKLSAFPSRLAMETAQRQLSNPDPLMRRAAVSALQTMPVEVRWQLLSPLITDQSKAVRFSVALALADAFGQAQEADAIKLRNLMAEYRESLNYNADSPGGQVAIGIFESQSGNRAQAEQAYQQALSIEPQFVPALINLADYYRSVNKKWESNILLVRALKTAPDTAFTNHAYALMLVRSGKQQEALRYLKVAVAQEDAQPHQAYVYAVALDSLGDTQAAIAVINAADKRWPNNLNLSMLQVAFMDKTGNVNGIHHYLSLLTAVAANNPQVGVWMKKYSGTKK